MNHSTVAARTTTPAPSTTSTGTAADTRPRAASSAAHRATSPSATAARADTPPAAGLRNLASSRRTTGTNPAASPSCRARNAPDPASATASRAPAWTVPRWLAYCGPAGRLTRNPQPAAASSSPTRRLNGNCVTSPPKPSAGRTTVFGDRSETSKSSRLRTLAGVVQRLTEPSQKTRRRDAPRMDDEVEPGPEGRAAQLVGARPDQARFRGRVQPLAHGLGPSALDVQQVGLEIDRAEHGYDVIGRWDVYP